MWYVINNLFLGDREDSRNYGQLIREGITHILNCSKELPCCFPDDFQYLKIELDDPDPDFSQHIEAICKFIDAGRYGGKVLVHCTAAVSRSPAVVLSYLCHLGNTLEQALKILKKQVYTNPDEEFLEQLKSYYGADES